MKNGMSYLATDAEVKGMIKALRAVPVITVEKDDDAGTAIAAHPGAGVIFRALDKRNGGWIVTHKDNLFA